MSSALARALEPILDRLDELERRLSLVPSVWDATVTSTSPTRIQRDAESGPIPSTPESLVPVGGGDRVRVLHWGTRYLILGVLGSRGRPWREAAGVVTLNMSGGAVTTYVNFPAGRFTTAPIITFGRSHSGASSATIPGADPTQVGVNGFSLGVYGSYTGTITVWWHAVQMTPTSAGG